MIVDLTDTDASGISGALLQARRHAGSPAMGMVLTLIVVADESCYQDAMAAAARAGREHPSRVLGVILRGGREAARLDAEVRVGGDAGPGESVLLRLYGPLARHPESIVTPLLLAESPVVVWWPAKTPPVPAEDLLGRLAQRRVVDSAAASRPMAALTKHCGSYTPGDTDLAWTRLTPWRALLAAALDQHPSAVRGARIEADRSNVSAELLAGWLDRRLGIRSVVQTSEGPGITAVRLDSEDGESAITRPDGRLARYEIPGQPPRHVALNRRSAAELLAEELRRLDPDDIYEQAVHAVAERRARTSNGRAGSGRSGTGGQARARSGQKRSRSQRANQRG